MYSAEEIIDILDIRLSKKRYQHSLNVAEEARKLAGHFDYPDPEKAYITGLLHDICKEIPKDEQLAMVKASDLDVTDVEIETPPLYQILFQRTETTRTLTKCGKFPIRALKKLCLKL